MNYVLIGVAVIGILLVIWVITGYNGFVKMRNRVEEGFATMDVYLKKRYDLIPNLVETVKGYAAHEKETLEEVVRARNAAVSASTMEGRLEGEAQLANSLKGLFALSESYPDLKANANFMELQGQLRRVEEDIANARKYYNALVREYNTKTETFPSTILAGLFHFSRKPLFEVNEAQERENVKVQF